jgi:hypothetical protein
LRRRRFKRICRCDHHNDHDHNCCDYDDYDLCDDHVDNNDDHCGHRHGYVIDNDDNLAACQLPLSG